jgi:hypothetical protein
VDWFHAEEYGRESRYNCVESFFSDISTLFPNVSEELLSPPFKWRMVGLCNLDTEKPTILQEKMTENERKNKWKNERRTNDELSTEVCQNHLDIKNFAKQMRYQHHIILWLRKQTKEIKEKHISNKKT